MLLQQLNRSDAEKVFIIAQAIGVGFTQGQLVCFSPTCATASLGNAVGKANVSNVNLFAGCMDSDTAVDAYGLVQVYGYRASIACASAGADGDSNGNAGDGFGPITGAFSASSNAISGVGVVLMQFTSTTGWASGLIRAL